MTDNIYHDEAIIRSVTYSTRGGHKVSFEVDPDGWEAFKGMETTRCMMVLVPIQNDGQPDPDAKPYVAPADRPKRRMGDMSRAQQAGILCGDGDFQRWMLGRYGNPDPRNGVRAECNVSSRSELDTNEAAGRTWDAMRLDYDVWRGATAAPR